MKRLWDGQRLIRAIDGEQPLAEATLEDYALVAQGLWDWSRQKPKQDYQPVVEKLVRIAWSNYFVEGRWVQSDTPLIPMMEGRLALDESSLPSATATVTRLSIRDRVLKKDSEIYQQAQQHLEQVRAYLGDSMFWYPSYVELLETAQSLR